MNTLRNLLLLSLLMSFLVVVLGAYTRLTHAGLGCPDWPGCYGLINVPETPEQILLAEEKFPERQVEPEKAWNEMIHRYFAGALGLLILIIVTLSLRLRLRQSDKSIPIKLPLLILAVVIFQAALGMWTVTMKLMPVVVMGHLLGGFTTLSLLTLLLLRIHRRLSPLTSQKQVSKKPLGLISNTRSKIPVGGKLQGLAFVGVIILTLQIALGGWVSSNYAALVCTELPICQSGWQQELTFSDSFSLLPPEKESYEFGHLDHASRLTIHVMHRFGAIVTSIYIVMLAFLIWAGTDNNAIKKVVFACLFVLGGQLSLGMSNIVFSLPLPIAVGHNVLAACLLLLLITLTYQLKIRTSV